MRHFAVIGAGLMGHGIALALARAGHAVALHDPVPEVIAGAKGRIAASLEASGVGQDEAASALARVECAESLPAAVRDADAVIEAAPEKLPLKQALFAEIETYAPECAILASNTSVLPISRIMEGLSGRHRALGTHWWNPPHLIPLVEVIRTEWTDDRSAQRMFDWLEAAGKSPVMVNKDIPGFVGNRLQHALWREAVSLVENGVCDAGAVDTVVKSGFGRRLAVLGPLENADLVGTDLTLDIHANLLHDLEAANSPSPYLRRLVESGRLGMKSGEGFLGWTDERAAAVRERLSRHLSGLDGFLAASAEAAQDQAQQRRT